MKTSFGNVAITVLVVMAGILIFSVNQSQAAPHLPSFYQSQYESQNPEYILQTLARLRQALIAEDDLENGDRPKKRNFGTDRGYTGNIEAIMRAMVYCEQHPSKEICKSFL
nr:uncharacterized protein LOC111420293 [Onthophagus taurus]